MIPSLKKIFREQRRLARKIAMRVLMNTKMVEGIYVREHIFKMFDHLNTLEILGGEIDVESQIDFILESLSNSFNQFKLNCSMDKIDFTLFETLYKRHRVLSRVILMLTMYKKLYFSVIFQRKRASKKRKRFRLTPT